MTGLEQQRARLVEGGASFVSERTSLRPLTHRQRQILTRIGMGLSHRQIASELGITHGSVVGYMYDKDLGIFVRLEANDQTHAIIVAVQRGELDLEEMTRGFDFHRFDRLTSREMELLTAMLEDYSNSLNKQLARKLKLNIRSVEYYEANIFRKLGLRGSGNKRTRATVLFLALKSINSL